MIKAVFRADASLDIGTGHVFRCLTLADELKQRGCKIGFVCRQHDGHLSELIQSRGFPVQLLQETSTTSSFDNGTRHGDWLGTDWQQDAEQTLQAIRQLFDAPVDWVVVDHYALDARWEQAIRPLAKKVFVIDDLADRSHDADVLLDQTLGRIASDYQPHLLRHNAKLLLGSQNSLLRPDFIENRSKALSRRQGFDQVNNLLITLGGVDIDNLSGKALDTLGQTNLSSATRINVVIGPSNPHRGHLTQQCRTSRFDCRLHVSTPNMAELMLEADLAIGAAGTTAWERCALALPTLTLCLADNQRDVIAALAAERAILPLPYQALSEPALLENAMSKATESYQAISLAAARLVDCRGAARTTLAMFQTTAKDGMPVRLRLAQADDARLLYQWQCAPGTRRFARNPEPPAWKEHLAWFERKLEQPDAVFTFIEYNNTPAGMLRLDRVAHSSRFEISILIAPELYRRGLAEAGIRLIHQAYPRLELLATVLPENQASHALFNRLGFQRISNTEYLKPAIAQS